MKSGQIEVEKHGVVMLGSLFLVGRELFVSMWLVVFLA